jgi:hypothetical protein
MSTSSAINYRETFFEFPTLTSIHGEPTYESLKTLQEELKANAQAVYSSLGGGAHGHLGLVLAPAQYALLSNVPFERPVHPGPLVIPPGTTNHMSTTMKEQHNEQVRMFREVMGVEKALRQQIVAAVEGDFLAALRNRHSNAITDSISDVLAYLFNTYGKVNPQMLSDEEDRVKQTVYDPKLPIDSVFNAVEDLLDFSTSAGTPYTQLQAINIAYVLVNKTGQFRVGIREWNRKPQNEKTWIHFKRHFREAHSELKESLDMTLADSNLQNANFVQQVVEGIAQVIQPSTEETETTDSILQHMANAASQNQQMLPQLLKQIEEMQTLMTKMQSQISDNQGNNQRQHRGSNAQQRKRNVSKYCWTHGACAHDGTECNQPAAGHKPNATFANKMGGSIRYCQPVSE